MDFKNLGIIEPILKVIEEERFETPSEIQIKSIPIILSGKDIIAGSATGSGKTLAFGSAIIQYCDRGQGIQSLVLVPTRELAVQVSSALRKFSKFKQLKIAAVYGGVAINPQMDALRRSEVVVGTPGRLLDHMQRKTIDLSKVKILVLDEADRMLDMGFIDDVIMIVKQCPRKRQTLLYSATISDDIFEIAKNYMNNPIEVSVESNVDPKKLTQYYYDVKDNVKFSLLVYLLKQERSGLVMVFCNTQRNTDFVAKNLKKNGVDAVAIHGGYSQARRTSTMEKFHAKNAHVLVCTDVAARGLDIKGVSHVYNYDLPKESKQYIHRIGRTARAGKEGKAVNVLSERDHDNFSRILRDNDVNIKKLETPQVPRVTIVRTENKFSRPGRNSFSSNQRPRRSGRPQFGSRR